MAPAGHTHHAGSSLGTGAALCSAWEQWCANPDTAGQKLFYSALVEQPLPCLPARPGASGLLAHALWQELQAVWTGMVPGLHRLSLQRGRLELNLWVLGGRFTREEALRQMDPTPLARHRTLLAGEVPSALAGHPHRAVVVGGGLSGAAVAYSLATRGWQVDVLDIAHAPASGASGLPLGLVAPHVSPDDALLSRLTRAGVRATLQRAAALLNPGESWQLSGSLERRLEHRRALPPTPDPATETCQAQWSRDATPDELAAAHLPSDSDALWHSHAGWVQPAALVRAQLNHPRIAWNGGADVARLERSGPGWAVLDTQDQLLRQAPLVVLATAYATRHLLHELQARQPGLQVPPYNALRGQVSCGRLPPSATEYLPAFPVHGHGSFLQGPGHTWIVGSTFERGATHSRVIPEDHALNEARLAVLLPQMARSATGLGLFRAPQGWAGVRCTLPDRLPTLGEFDPEHAPGLLLCAGMGARGLTLSVLCGEVLAAALHREPWPLEEGLVRALSAQRFHRPLATGKVRLPGGPSCAHTS